MATILERIQEKYPYQTADARNIAEAIGMVYGTGGRGSGNIAGVLYKNVTLTFDPNGGSGELFSIAVPSSGAGLIAPPCPFTPPEGKEFDYWFPNVSGTDREASKIRPGVENNSGFGADLTLYAIWKDAE